MGTGYRFEASKEIAVTPGISQSASNKTAVGADSPQAFTCHLVGGGVAGLASAVYLLREGQVPGSNIRILESSHIGGSLDAAGSAERGYSMRGSRMFGPAYVLTYDLLDGIPSLDDPDKSVAQDIFEFWQSTPWYDQARLVEGGKIVDAS